MFPMDRKPVSVTVEYDCQGSRKQKLFTDAYAARRFYSVKLKQHKSPKVLDPSKVPNP